MDPEDELVPVTLQWIAPAHLKTHRTTDWYWALGIIAIFGTVACVIWGNILFAIIIALGAIMIIVMAIREPRELEIEITPDGIHIDHDFYPYPSIYSFWVADYAAQPKLFLSTTGLIHPHITIPLTPDAQSHHVRSYLEQYLPEESGHSLGSFLAEFLGF